MSKPLIHYS